MLSHVSPSLIYFCIKNAIIGAEETQHLCPDRRVAASRRGGSQALRVGASPGRPLKLRPAPRRRLVKSLLKGPIAHGFGTNLWTTARIVEVIEREFGVNDHRDHVGRLMHGLEWTRQKPETRAVEREEEAR